MIYISGRITGNKNWEDDFHKAEEELLEKGYKVIINPLNLDEQVNKDWEDAIKENEDLASVAYLQGASKYKDKADLKDEELNSSLQAVFSRSGFTKGYFEGNCR